MFRIPAPHPGVQAALDAVLRSRPELRPGKMFGCPGYFVGSKSVASVFGSEVCLTLPPSEIEKLLARPGIRPFEAGGRTMSGWILLDRAQVEALAKDPTLVEQSIAYARAKATQRKA